MRRPAATVFQGLFLRTFQEYFERWGRMIGFKAGACAASVVAEEHFARRGSSGVFCTAMNGIGAGSFAVIAIRNRQIAGQPRPPDKPALTAVRPVAKLCLELDRHGSMGNHKTGCRPATSRLAGSS